MVASWLLVLLSAVSTGPDTVVVSPPQFLDSLRPWVAHRAAQGHRFAFVTNAGTPEQIRTAIRQHARLGSLKYVVLVGDAEPAARVDPLVRARSVPTHMRPAVVDVQWGSTPTLPTDSWYADLDDDDIPDLAIGRLPADNPADLRNMISKTLAYESTVCPGAWCQRINLVAGLGDFGTLIDPVLEMATRHFLSDGIPPAYDTPMTYGNWHSPYCPSPYSFHSAALARFNEGSLFWVYIGHGYPYQLDRIRVPGRSFHILNTSDVYKLDAARTPPIAIMLACYTGAFDQPLDCLAEQMLRAPGGPVAVLAGSRITMPYGMAVLGNGLIDAYFQHHAPTLGQAILDAKRRMSDPNPAGTNRKLLDLIAAALSPNADSLAQERAEHVALFNLLGDPLLRLYYPQAIQVEVNAKAAAGSYLEVRAQLPYPGLCTVQLVTPRGTFRHEPPRPGPYVDSTDVQAARNRTYLMANDRSWTSRQVAADDRTLLTALKIPPEARGRCYVVVTLENPARREYAIGAANIAIRSPNDDSRPAEARLQDNTSVRTATRLSDGP